jgi:glycosyltransferase involved in cell wall biosynthesis
MKVLKLIHGYPMRYNAGSEVYTQTLCHGLVRKGHEVQVFTRQENPFMSDYSIQQEIDILEPAIKLNLVNLPLEKHRYSYRIETVDELFYKTLKKFNPDIVHIGHLNHLSVSLLTRIPDHIPVIYTLHDYWLLCPRGLFIQRSPKNPNDVWALCSKQDDSQCAKRCYPGYFSGAIEDRKEDTVYWEKWIARRMAYIKSVLSKIDYFIAPSVYLLQRYRRDLCIPSEKLVYLDYGFDIKRCKNRQKKLSNRGLTFGYIGTHIPAKGIQLLIQAFGKLKGDCQLKIWGRPRGQNTAALREFLRVLPQATQNQIEWLPEYCNTNIVNDVFNHIDAIVVPSIWEENSPLVIHEAQQARIPVITANIGGMAEYVQHKVNGLLFKHRDINSLAATMQLLLDNPDWAEQLGSRGYLQSSNGDVPSIEDHVFALEQIYEQALCAKGENCYV